MTDVPSARVVHLDEALAVIDKPAGLVVHPAPSHRGPTLVDQLSELLGGGDPERPGIVHRLDKDTSGLLVVARTEEAQRALAAQVAAREVDRVYLALARGQLESRTGTIDAPIGRERRTRTRMAVSGAGAREARTHFTVLELLRRRQLPRGEAGDRAHAPDPRPLRRDRAPAGRRPHLRRRRGVRPEAPVPARPPARLQRTRRAASGSSSPPSCQPNSTAALQKARH